MFHNLLALAASIFLVILYYSFLNWRTRRNPQYTVHAMNRMVRQRWVEMVMASDKMDILAVQTLRNSVMASNFMASTAVLLIIGILSVSGNADKLAAVWEPLMATENPPKVLWLLKLGLLLFNFFVAFYCFSMSIRFFNHVGYMINLPTGPITGSFSPSQIGAYLNRAGTYYSMGTRAFFFSLPLVFWFLGPLPLILSTLVLITCLYPLDRAIFKQ